MKAGQKVGEGAVDIAKKLVEENKGFLDEAYVVLNILLTNDEVNYLMTSDEIVLDKVSC